MIKKLLNTIRGNRRGVAIELALVTMIVILAFSGIIVTTSALQNKKRLEIEERIQTSIEEKVLLEEIGARFCNTMLSGMDQEWISIPNTYEGYLIGFRIYTPDGEDSSVSIAEFTLTRDGTEDTILEITVKLEDATQGDDDEDVPKKCTILSWNER